MAESMNLGIVPGTLRVHLTAGADFTSTIRLSSNWPGSTTLTLNFDSGETWTASISTTDAVFAVDKATTDTIADGTGVRLKYVNGTTDQTWEIGTVVRHD